MPADRSAGSANFVVARVLAGTLAAMGPEFPEPPEDVKAFAERELGVAR